MMRLLALLCILTLPVLPTAEPKSASGPTAAKAWAILFQVMETLERALQARELSLVHAQDFRVYQATVFLRSADQVALLERKEGIETGWLAFGRKMGILHQAADSYNQELSESRLKDLQAAIEEMKTFYNDTVIAEARSLSEQHICPMHPDVRGRRIDLCAKCGMELSLPVILSLSRSGSFAVAPRSVQAQIRTESPLSAGVRATAYLTLRRFNGSPVQPDALREVHTQKIHLLIIDSSLKDYHHEHPVLTDTPGEYLFSFVPKRTGHYRAWADIQTYDTGFQEYAPADITGSGAGEPVSDKAVSMTGVVEGLRYDLGFEEPTLRVGQPVKGTLRITKGKRGKPFEKLEPLMGTFAHFVAFHEDRETVLHMHPKGAKALGPKNRGGPDLEFQFYATKAGFYRLFAQVQIDGLSKFVPFGVAVSPGLEPEGL